MSAPAKEEFRIDSEEKLDWLLRKMLQIDAAEEAVKANSKAEIESLRAQRATLKNRFNADVEQFLTERVYAKSNLKKDGTPRKKTFQFLYGKAGLRAQAPGWVLEDKEAALAWARNHVPAAVKTETAYSLDLDEYKATATASGEVLPGIVWKEGGDSPSLQPGRPKEDG
ncbi:MAG TPA: host-nuclease inhibitor Gam family protein [Polyangia bacterium]|nr:host-nuclease inhibitor Gam family protein [Polyangia bacterium]